MATISSLVQGKTTTEAYKIIASELASRKILTAKTYIVPYNGYTYTIKINNIWYHQKGAFCLDLQVWRDGNELELHNPCEFYGLTHLAYTGMVSATYTAEDHDVILGRKNVGDTYLIPVYTENPYTALLDQMMNFLHTKPLGKYHPIGSPTSTTSTIYPVIDGDVYYTISGAGLGKTWAEIVAITTGTTANSTRNYSGPECRGDADTTDKFDYLTRTIWSFDTGSIIDDTATITAAALHLSTAAQTVWTVMGVPNFTVTGGDLISHTALAVGDYDGCDSTVYITTPKAYDTFSNNTEYVFELTSGAYTYISKTDHTIFFGRSNWDASGTFGGSYVGGGESSYYNFYMLPYGGVTRPHLEVTWGSPVAAPVIDASQHTTHIDISWS